MGTLSRILEAKQQEVRALRAQRFPSGPPVRAMDLRRGDTDPLRLIAEIKLRSPSAGKLSTRLSVAERARAYEQAGASAISVLCDQRFFDGGFSHLTEARAASTLPILAKEFVIDAVQLDAARAAGADAILLIVRCLEPTQLAELIQAATERGLQPLVEVFNEAETELALRSGATLVGVNARDLDTLEMNVERAAQLVAALPQHVAAVQLSGLAAPERVSEVARGRADAALLGEVLMRQDNPRPLLEALCAAAATERVR